MSTHPAKYICDAWLAKIGEAAEHKKAVFGVYAREAEMFFDADHNKMWDSHYREGMRGFMEEGGYMPTFRMQVNKVFEAVAIFGPALFHRYPQVLVTPVDPPEVSPESLGIDPQAILAQAQAGPMDPMAMAMVQAQLAGYQQQLEVDRKSRAVRGSIARASEHYLNWVQVESDKKSQARLAITEAIVKGMGLLSTEIYQPVGSSIKYPRSAFRSVDDLVVDHDATCWDDVQWIALRCVHPVNKVEEYYGLEPNSLKGNMFSGEAVSQRETKRSIKRNQQGGSYDLIEYWKVYSKNGFGQLLKTSGKVSLSENPVDFKLFGRMCHLVVAKGIPYPLNVPPGAWSEPPETLAERTTWPVPYWMDEGVGNGWPIAPLWFYDKPNSVWPISLIKPAIGEIRFVNWCMSFLADRAAASCTTYLGIMKAASKDIQDQLRGNQAPFKIIDVAEMFGKPINELMAFVNAPDFPSSIWTMVMQALELIDKRTGLSELAYGLSARQMRSAQEVTVKNEAVQIRPDEMANRTDDWLSMVALKEIQAAVWGCGGQDVKPILGPLGAAQWDTQIATQPFESVVREYSYRVAAGSARKPNKGQKLASLLEFGQIAGPTMQAMAAQGQVGPWNAYAMDVAQAMDLPNPERYMVEPPPPPMPLPVDPAAEGAAGEVVEQA